MSFKDSLEDIIIFQVTRRTRVSSKGSSKRRQAYYLGRRWLKFATGEELPSWQEAVTQLEKQLSNK